MMATSHIDRSNLHRCYVTGCIHHGTLSRGSLDQAYCKYHFGASQKNMAAITARVNSVRFKRIHDNAIKLINDSPGRVISSGMLEWLQQESPEIAAFASGHVPATAQSAGSWLLKVLQAYATHDLLSGEPVKRLSDPSWSEMKSTLAQSRDLQKLGLGGEDAGF